MPLNQEPFTFEDLTEICRREQKSKYPVEVRPDFYLAVRECRDRLKKEIEREFSVDQYSLKAKLASNQLIKFQEKSQQVFEFRFAKIQSMGLRAALGNRVDLRKLTPEELEFFNLIVEIISSKKSMLIGGEFTSTRTIDNYVAPVKKEPPVLEVPKPEVIPEPEIIPDEEEVLPPEEEPFIEEAEPEEFVPEEVDSNSDGPTIESAEEEVSEELPQSDRVLVRILADIPEIAGSDRNFRLKKEDVVTLPSPIAKILIKQNVARQINIRL